MGLILTVDETKLVLDDSLSLTDLSVLAKLKSLAVNDEVKDSDLLLLQKSLELSTGDIHHILSRLKQEGYARTWPHEPTSQQVVLLPRFSHWCVKQ